MRREEWLDTETAAKLLGITARGLRKAAQRGDFIHCSVASAGTGRGGKTLKVLLSSLPPAAQRVYHERRLIEARVPVDTERWFGYPEWAREKALLREAAVMSFRILKAIDGRRPALDAWISDWNSEHPDTAVTRATIYRWDQAYTKDVIYGLLPRWGSAAEADITEADWDAFRSLYLDQAKRSVTQCYQAVRLYAEDEGRTIPSMATFKRRLEAEIPEDAVIMAREGSKTYNDKRAPYIERDYTSIDSNEWWVADHHQLDILVRLQDKLIRPYITLWMDVRSRYVVGFELAENPSEDTVLKSFRDAVLRYGVPYHAYLDNGKEFKAKDFAGRPRRGRVRVQIDEAWVTPHLNKIGVTPHFTIPYHAQSKPVERLFRTLKEQFSRDWLTYTAGNVVDRPERLKEVVKTPDAAPTAEEIIEALNRWLDGAYHQNVHSGQGMEGRPPAEVYVACLKEKRVARKEDLAVLLMRRVGPLTVQRNGVRVFGRWFTDNDKLDLRIGARVYVRYNMEQPGSALVFDEENKFVCNAHNRELVRWGATGDEIKEAMREKTRRRRIAKAYVESAGDFIKEPDDLKRVIDRRRARAAAAAPNKPDPPVLRVIDLGQMNGVGRQALNEQPAAIAVGQSDRRSENEETMRRLEEQHRRQMRPEDRMTPEEIRERDRRERAALRKALDAIQKSRAGGEGS